MSGRVIFLVFLVAVTAACASTRKREAEESVETVIADLIEETRDLRNFRVVYVGEGDPKSWVELVYEHPSRARLTAVENDEKASVWFLDGVIHGRSPEEYADLDMKPFFERMLELDRELFDVLSDRSVPPPVQVDLVRLRIEFTIGRSSGHPLPWLHRALHDLENSRLEEENVVRMSVTGPKAYISRRTGFPTRIPAKSGGWAILQEVQTHLDLDERMFEVPDPTDGAKNSSVAMLESSSEPLYDTYRFLALTRIEGGMDPAVQEANWKRFHEERVGAKLAAWVEQSLGSIDELADRVANSTRDPDLEQRIEKWGSEMFNAVDQTRDQYLSSLAAAEETSLSDKEMRARAIERDAAEAAFDQVVEDPLERRWNEFLLERY